MTVIALFEVRYRHTDGSTRTLAHHGSLREARRMLQALLSAHPLGDAWLWDAVRAEVLP